MPIPTPLRALLVLCSMTAGCAQTANVRCWQPADIATGGVRRLAVVGAADEDDQRAAVVLERQIQQGSAFELVEHAQVVLAGYSEDDDAGLGDLLRYSQQADVDAVVVVDVQQFQVDSPSRSTLWNSLWDDTERTAMVRVEFQLIDTGTSAVLARREISRRAAQYEWKMNGSLRDEGMLDRLLDECVAEFVAVLEPRETEAAIELAEGEWFSMSGPAVRRGVRFARAGRWQQAREAWNRAIDRNQNNDAALFNLAVASAQAGDYAAAEDYAMQALRIRHTECYAAGLERIRELRSDSEPAEFQMRTAVVPAGYTDKSSPL